MNTHSRQGVTLRAIVTYNNAIIAKKKEKKEKNKDEKK